MRGRRVTVTVLVLGFLLVAGALAFRGYRGIPRAEAPANLTLLAASSSPPSITVKGLPLRFSMYAGDTKTLSFSFTNKGPTLTASLSIVVTSVPPGGSASDVTITYPKTVVLPKGTTTTVTITIAVSQSAVPGAYLITTTVTGG